MVCLEGPHIFPLCVANLGIVMDRDPAAFADRDALALVTLPEPWNHFGSFGAVAEIFADIVVGQCDVERVQSGHEALRKKSGAVVRIVIAPVI